MREPHQTAVAIVLAALMVGAPFAEPAQAQSDNAFDRVDPGLEDGAFIGLVLPLNVGLALNPTSPNARQAPPSLDRSVRRALRWDDVGLARDLADIFFLSTVSAAAFMPLLAEWSIDETSLRGTLVGFQALLTTSLLTELTKQLTGRQRPNEYYSTDPEEPEHFLFFEEGAGYSNRSFFSGHTSMTFSAATMLTIFAWEYDWLDDDLRWIVPATAYSAAALTGYFRIAGDNHWLSDVLVGAFVGTGASYLVFALQTQ